jgi:hypothetical protein
MVNALNKNASYKVFYWIVNKKWNMQIVILWHKQVVSLDPHVIDCFSSSLSLRQNKLERLPMDNILSLV